MKKTKNKEIKCIVACVGIKMHFFYDCKLLKSKYLKINSKKSL